MSADLNNICVIGRLTRDPELRYTPNGKPVTTFTVANNKQVKKKAEGENKNKDDVNFFKVIAWNQLAEFSSKYLKKGKQVAVTGRIEQRSYMTADNQKRIVYEIIANTINFVSGGMRPSGDGSQQQAVSNTTNQEHPAVSDATNSEHPTEQAASGENEVNTDFESPIDDNDIPVF